MNQIMIYDIYALRKLGLASVEGSSGVESDNQLEIGSTPSLLPAIPLCTVNNAGVRAVYIHG